MRTNRYLYSRASTCVLSFGTLPLLMPTEAGSELEQATLGTAVFFGKLGVTAFGPLFTPTFNVVCPA
jgi:multidrug efflux pump subunit AcrB